jgi:hypothetical protein
MRHQYAMWCLLNSPFKLEAIAIPSAAEIEVEEGPAKGIVVLSLLLETRNTAELTVV